VHDNLFHLHYGDLSDSSNLTRIIKEVQPDEIYNLAAQSHVVVSFEAPEYTAGLDVLGTLRILEAMRFLGLEKKTCFYQASTSLLFGLVQETLQRETTPFYPRSTYAVAKMYAYWITVNYRESYGTPRKIMDVNRLSSLGWTDSGVLEQGLGMTYQWFLGYLDELFG